MISSQPLDENQSCFENISGERYKIKKTRATKGKNRKQKVCKGRTSTEDCREVRNCCAVSVIVGVVYKMHGIAARNFEHNGRWGWPDGHCDACTWESHSSRRCMDMLMTEKEHDLGTHATASTTTIPAGYFLKRFDPNASPFPYQKSQNIEKTKVTTEKEINEEKTKSNQWKIAQHGPSTLKETAMKGQKEDEGNNTTTHRFSNRHQVLQDEEDDSKEDAAPSDEKEKATNKLDEVSEIKKEEDEKISRDARNTSLKKLACEIQAAMDEDKCSSFEDYSTSTSSLSSEISSADDSMGLTKEERRFYDNISIDDSTLDGELESKESNEEDMLMRKLSEEEDESKETFEKLRKRLESLQYQNEVSIQRLHELESAEEHLRREIMKKDEMHETKKKENDELKKELAVKKKFVFKMGNT